MRPLLPGAGNVAAAAALHGVAQHMDASGTCRRPSGRSGPVDLPPAAGTLELMADLSLIELGVLVVGGGGVSGLVQTYLGPRLTHGFEMKRLRQETDLARARRTEERHEAAAEKYVPLAVGVHRWVEHQLWELLGPDLGIFDPQDLPEDVTKAPEAIAQVGRIAAGHPTLAVRESASLLQRKLIGYYSEPSPDGRDHDPSLREHIELADHLLEVLHEPSPPPPALALPTPVPGEPKKGRLGRGS